MLPFRPELTWPADLYLEGSDQHRGWFQSSLLVGLGTRGRAAVQAGRHPRLRRRRRRQEDVEVARQHDPAAGHHQAERRRDRPALGRDGRLPRGSPPRQADHRARRRSLPEDPEHAAVSGVEPVRLRSGRSGAARSRWKRSIAMRWRAMPRLPAPSSTRMAATTTRRSSRRSTSSRPSISARSTPTSRRIASIRLAPRRRSAARHRPRCTRSPTGWSGCWRRSCRSRPTSCGVTCRARARNRSTWPSSRQAADLAAMRDEALERRWEVLLEARSAVNAKLEVLREKKAIGSSLQASVTIDVDDAAAAALLKRYADTLPMLFIVSERDARAEGGKRPKARSSLRRRAMARAAVDHRCCTRARREVPTMLAGRTDRVVRRRQPRAVRALRGRDDRRRGRRMMPDERPRQAPK